MAGAPIECDDFQIGVLFNQVDYEIREDHGESIVKSHYVCVCVCVCARARALFYI